MTNRDKLAALISENAEMVLSHEALRFDSLAELFCDRSLLHPDGCAPPDNDCFKCIKAWLDAPVSVDLHFEDGFVFPDDTGFIVIGGTDGED